MQAMLRKRNAIVILAVGMGLWLAAAGCTSFQDEGKTSAKPKAVEKKNAPLYYDFGDVLIPKALGLDRQKSFVQKLPGSTTGVLTFSGRVDTETLIAFFNNSMAMDNWKQIMFFKSSPRTIMLFAKQNRRCIIRIDDQTLTTRVEIWVAPVSAASGLLKQ